MTAVISLPFQRMVRTLLSETKAKANINPESFKINPFLETFFIVPLSGGGGIS